MIKLIRMHAMENRQIVFNLSIITLVHLNNNKIINRNYNIENKDKI